MVQPVDHTEPTAHADATTNPLSDQEKQAFIETVEQAFHLTKEQAQQMLTNLSPEEVRTFTEMSHSAQGASREQLQKMLGLTDEQADILLGPPNPHGVYTNPFGDVFLQFLMLLKSLNVDLQLVAQKMLQAQVEFGLKAADEKFKGAIAKFATALVAAGVTVVCAGVNAGLAFKYRKEAATNKDDPNYKPKHVSQWAGPMGAQLIGQPITATGDFVDAVYEKESEQDTVYAQEARSIYDRIVESRQSVHDSEKAAAEALSH